MKKLSIIAVILIAVVGLVGLTACNAPQWEYGAISMGYGVTAENSGLEETSGVQSGIVEYKTPSTRKGGDTENIKDTQERKENKGVLKQMYVRIVGENEVEELGDWIEVDGVRYTNPTKNPNIDIKALGFKQLFIDDTIPYDSATQRLQRYYYEKDNLIHRGWKVVDLSEEEIEAEGE